MKSSHALLILTVSLTLLAASTCQATDSQLHAEIERRFAKDDALYAHQLDVSVKQGAVQLSGMVRNLLLRDRAERIVEAVPGITFIDNQVKIIPAPGRTDRRIRNDLRLALALDSAIELDDLKLTVVGGTVNLRGTVQSHLERDFAVRAAKSIRGVLAVKDLILVKTKDIRPDEEIREELQHAMNRDAWLLGDEIYVKVADGRVALSGTVATLAKRRRAFNRCWTAGVRTVDANQIRVGVVAPGKRSLPTLSDAEIRQEIKMAFVLNPHLLSTRVEVAVHRGVVNLTGKVRSLRAVSEARREAYGVTGVRRVHNYLKVSPETPRTDRDIRESIISAFDRDAVLEDEPGITVTVVGGAAFLKGMASTGFAKSHAENIVATIPGVVRVSNQLSTTDSRGYDSLAWDREYNLRPYYEGIPTTRGLAEQDLRDDVYRELKTSPFIDADNIVVAVNTGTVTLTGKVDSWHERRVADEVTRRAGATHIVNRLAVRNEYNSK